MPRSRTFSASVVAALIVLSVFGDRGATEHDVTGSVAEFQEGRWISLAFETPSGVRPFQINLPQATTYEGHPAAIKPGVRVIIWYRKAPGERAVADRIRVLPDTATR